MSVPAPDPTRLPHRAALAVFLFLIALLPLAVPSRYYLNVMIFAGIHVLLTVGLNLVMGYAGQVSLGHAGFYGLGAYASGVLTVKYGVNPWVAMAAALGLSLLVGLAIGIPSLHLQGYYLGMATLGFGIILHILFVELLPFTGGPSGLVGIPEISLLGVKLNTDTRYYYLVWVVVGAVLLFAFHLVDSRVGRALRAIQGDETAAALMGINTWLAKVRIFVTAAAFASVAGSLYAHYVTFLSPDSFGFGFSIDLIVMVIVGGTRSIWGSVLGAVLLTILPEYLRGLKDYDILVYGAVVILVVMFVPSGIAGAIEQRLQRWRLKLATRARVAADA
ncbi:MAG: branched-chain amino acid ABC transporter permease [Candidatus Rokubacteria bacterium]|nr:branched-chain amino acid ABC transporter permease [Candidatus Rokubacteria bacterium]